MPVRSAALFAVADSVRSVSPVTNHIEALALHQFAVRNISTY